MYVPLVALYNVWLSAKPVPLLISNYFHAQDITKNDRFGTVFLAHLNRRLTRLTYRIAMIRCPSLVCPSFTVLNIFSQTTWPIEAKFCVEPPWVGGTKVCSWHLGHMSKTAGTPIYGQTLSKISGTSGPISMKLYM